MRCLSAVSIFVLTVSSLGLFQSEAKAAWAKGTQWRVKPIKTPASNPGWVYHDTEAWPADATTKEPSIQPELDGRAVIRYRKGPKVGKPKLIKVTPANVAKVRNMLNHASEIMSSNGFNEPLVPHNYGFWEAKLFPDEYIFDGQFTDPGDTVWGMFAGKGEGSVTAGEMYVAREWEADHGVSFIHELFHSVGASYAGFSGIQQDLAGGCPQPCWLSEGMAEGFAAYWAKNKGSHFLKQPYKARNKRSYESALAVGSTGPQNYRNGQATGRFWQYVADKESLRALHQVLSQSDPQANNGLTAVNEAFQGAGLKGLAGVYPRFVARELTAPGDYKNIVTYQLNPEKEPIVSKKIKFEQVASRAIRVRFQPEKDTDYTLTIKAKDGAAESIHIAVNNQDHGPEFSVNLSKLNKPFDQYFKLAHVSPNASATDIQDLEIEVSLAANQCGMLPAEKVSRLEYAQFGDVAGKPQILANFTYDFAKSKRTQNGRITEVALQIVLHASGRTSTSNAQVSFRCEKGQVMADGGFQMMGLDLGANGMMGRATGSMQIKQIHNSLGLPSSPHAGQVMADGSSQIEAQIGGKSALQIQQNQRSRRISGQETLRVAGAGDLKCWKMTSQTEMGLTIQADALVGDEKTPGTQAVNDYMAQMLGESSDLQGFLLSQAGKAVMQQAVNGLADSLSQQSKGQLTTWFAPGIGLVKSEQTTASGKSTLLLQRVSYRAK